MEVKELLIENKGKNMETIETKNRCNEITTGVIKVTNYNVKLLLKVGNLGYGKTSST